MTLTMTARGQVLLNAVRLNFSLLAELDKTAPGDVDIIVGAIVGHLRSWRPMSLVKQTETP